ncbi:MAG: hypothetical protein AAGE65_09980, partial [Planctomycetota bacterium]
CGINTAVVIPHRLRLAGALQRVAVLLLADPNRSCLNRQQNVQRNLEGWAVKTRTVGIGEQKDGNALKSAG